MKTSLPANLTWIWTNHDPDAHGQIGQFRLRFRADKTAHWIGFADTLYTLFCNGRVVGVGPYSGHRSKPWLTRWDLTPFLHDGENVLALEVWFEGRRNDCTDYDTVQAGVVGWLETTTPHPNPLPASGARGSQTDSLLPIRWGEGQDEGSLWKARHAAGYTLPGPEGWRGFASHRLIIADLRNEPADWMLPDFDDAGWATATIRQRDGAGLRVSDLPPQTVTRVPVKEVFDAGVARGDAPVVFAEDIAKRMLAQQHESQIRPGAKVPGIFGQAGEIAFHRPAVPVQLPAQIPAVDGEYFLTVDFGIQTSGCVVFDIETEGDVTVDIGYSENLINGRVNPRAQDHSLAERVIVGKGRRIVRMPHDHGFRYAQLSFNGKAMLHDLAVEEHIYPHDAVRRFQCSDPALNAIWDVAVASLRQCALTTLVDNARRERQGWGGPDLVVTNRGYISAFGDTRLVRKKFEDFCDYFDAKGFIPCWTPGVGTWVHGIPAHDLWFPTGCWEYLLVSDDRDFAARLLKVSEAVMQWFEKHREGDLYVNTEGWKWTEWNFRSADVICTWENLLAVQAWRAIAKMRKYLGLTGTDTADAMARAIVDRLWHPGHGALSQGVRSDGKLSDFCGQVDNAVALSLDILPAEKRAAAIRFCGGASGTWPTSRSGWQGNGSGQNIRHDPRKPVVAGSPFASDLCAQAMFHIGQHAEAVQYIRYNFGALVDEGEGGTWESWPIFNTDYPATCFSQSFGAGVAGTLVAEVVGLRHAAPGGTVVEWRPARCGLAWAEGRIETVHGPVIVRWEGDRREQTVPAGVELHIIEDK